MTLEWTLDGVMMSILVDMEGDANRPIGIAMKNTDNTWTAFDCTRSNEHNTTAYPTSQHSSREEAKIAVEKCFREPTPDASHPNLKADFTSDAQQSIIQERLRWSLAVERRWNEICCHLELHLEKAIVQDEKSLITLLSELRCLYAVTQYAGSNSRTGWIVTIRSYYVALGMTISCPE